MPAFDLVLAGFGLLPGLFGLLFGLLIDHNRRWNVAMLAAVSIIMPSTGILEDFI